ncbi:MAG: hypothetical protein AAGA83_14895 [Cyanobacteria bacterium P01_F01_bin.116]
MVTINDSRWPLVSVQYQGTGTLDEMTFFHGRFEVWLAEQERFVLVIQQDDSNVAKSLDEKSPEAKQMGKQNIAWAKTHKLAIAQYCAGIAMVPYSKRLIALWKPLVAIGTRKMYGCPGKVFGSLDEAHGWAEAQLL